MDDNSLKKYSGPVLVNEEEKERKEVLGRINGLISC
jgi:hypothetical protein